MRVGQIERALFVQITVVNIGLDDFRDKHVMRTEFQNLTDLAFKTDRGFRDQRSFDGLGFFGMDFEISGQGELVDFAAGFDADIIGEADQFLSRKTQNEFSGALDYIVGIARFTD